MNRKRAALLALAAEPPPAGYRWRSAVDFCRWRLRAWASGRITQATRRAHAAVAGSIPGSWDHGMYERALAELLKFGGR